jgi:hypothetical protein
LPGLDVGFGDEIMVTGEARRLQRNDRRPVQVLDRNGRPRRHPLWADNPRFWRPGMAEPQRIANGPGCRPYLDYAAMGRDWRRLYPRRPFSTRIRDARLPWRFTSWRAAPGELTLPRGEPNGLVVVEPHVKPGASPNKDWGWERWQALVRTLRLPWAQLGLSGTRVLPGVTHVPTRTFEEACRVLDGAAAAVLPEGGLHHAAAALGVPAVVIFGGYAAPANLGYDAHVNLYSPDGSPCGQRVACDHCAAAMAAIAPQRVAEELERLL